MEERSVLDPTKTRMNAVHIAVQFIVNGITGASGSNALHLVEEEYNIVQEYLSVMRNVVELNAQENPCNRKHVTHNAVPATVNGDLGAILVIVALSVKELKHGQGQWRKKKAAVGHVRGQIQRLYRVTGAVP